MLNTQLSVSSCSPPPRSPADPVAHAKRQRSPSPSSEDIDVVTLDPDTPSPPRSRARYGDFSPVSPANDAPPPPPAPQQLLPPPAGPDLRVLAVQALIGLAGARNAAAALPALVVQMARDGRHATHAELLAILRWLTQPALPLPPPPVVSHGSTEIDTLLRHLHRAPRLLGHPLPRLEPADAGGGTPAFYDARLQPSQGEPRPEAVIDALLTGRRTPVRRRQLREEAALQFLNWPGRESRPAGNLRLLYARLCKAVGAEAARQAVRNVVGVDDSTVTALLKTAAIGWGAFEIALVCRAEDQRRPYDAPMTVAILGDNGTLHLVNALGERDYTDRGASAGERLRFARDRGAGVFLLRRGGDFAEVDAVDFSRPGKPPCWTPVGRRG